MPINPRGVSALSLPLTDAVYTFVDKRGQPTHIASDALLRAVKRSGIVPIRCVMAANLIAAIERGDLNQEEDHALKLPDAALEAPVIVGEWDGEHIIIDGTHRLWRRYKRGDRDFPAYVVPEQAWRHFVIYDMPEDLVPDWADHLKNSRVRS